MRANQTLKQKIRRLELREAKRKHAQVTEIDTNPLQIERIKGGTGKRLTLQSFIALAIRRNFGNCATADVGAMLLEDISRFTVCRSESKTGTALIASSRLFFHAMLGDLRNPSTGAFKLVIHSFLQDATNAGILKGSKLSALILRSAFLKEQPPGDDVNNHFLDEGWQFDDWFDRIIRVADVLPVVAGDSGVTVAQTLKQLEGLGCPTWKDIQNNPDLQGQLSVQLQHVLLYCQVCVCLCEGRILTHRHWHHNISRLHNFMTEDGTNSTHVIVLHI